MVLEPLREAAPKPADERWTSGTGHWRKGRQLAMETRNDSLSASRPKVPKILFVIAISLPIIGIVTTPELLIALGPLKKSLISRTESVREIAHLTVLSFRVFCVLLGVLFAACIVFWVKIAGCSFARKINEHAVLASPRHEAIRGPWNWALVITAAGVVLGFLHVALAPRLLTEDQLHLVQKEDGLIENISTLVLLICSLVSLRLARRFSGLRARRIVHYLFALAFFMMAGEEISWGQRIFDIETPDWIDRSNVQGETNLHNSFGYLADHLFVLCVFVYGFGLPVLARIYTFQRKAFDYFGLPIASLGLAIGFALISMIQFWTVYRILPRGPLIHIPEIREMLTAVAFLLLMYECWLLSTPPAAAQRAT